MSANQLTTSEAQAAWQQAKRQAEESRQDYLAAYLADSRIWGPQMHYPEFGVIQSALIYAEAANREVEAFEIFNELLTQEWAATIAEELASATS